MDDVMCLIAVKQSNDKLFIITAFQNYIQHRLYDQEHSLLTLKKQNTDKYLDTQIIIYNNEHSIKIIYNNKNNDLSRTLTQSIGRYHNCSAPSLMQHKISAALSTIVRIYDFTTFESDMIKPTLQIL